MGSMTKQQMKKQAKVKNRQKRIAKTHNIQQNAPDKRFRLDVKIDGRWRIGIKSWSALYQVESHRIDTERRRALGEEIVEGQVGDMVTGKIVLKIAGSGPGEKMKGSAPDKITDGVKAADMTFSVVTKTDEPPTVKTI